MIRANKNTGRGDGDNGFIVLYAAKNVDVPYVPQQSCGLLGGSHSFCQQRYYLNFKGVWRGPFNPNTRVTDSTNSLSIQMDGRANALPNPKFNIWLYKPLGNQTWDTIVYVMDNNGTDQLRDFLVPLRQ